MATIDSALSGRVALLPRESRQGTTITNVSTLPADLVTIRAGLDLSAADMDDPNTQITATVFVSPDGGRTWTAVGGGSWTGGPDTQKNGATRAWSLGLNDSRWAGLPIRVELIVPARRAVGVNLDT